MANIDEVLATAKEVAVSAEDANLRLDAINTKIDASAAQITALQDIVAQLQALLEAGGAVTGPQLDEIATSLGAAKASLKSVSDDLIDAEQS